VGDAVRVEWIDLPESERTRLRELGISQGSTLHVVQCGAFGARVVAVGSDRFAIDGDTCRCISVTLGTDDSAHVMAGVGLDRAAA
jgi:ferrous iron transport protein A